MLIGPREQHLGLEMVDQQMAEFKCGGVVWSLSLQTSPGIPETKSRN